MASFSDRVRVSTAVTCILSGFVALGQAGSIAETEDAQLSARDWVPDGYYVPPYYPAPYGGWVDSWQGSYAKAKALVDSMTLAEKTNITAGTGIYMGKFGMFTLESQIWRLLYCRSCIICNTLYAD
jgi:hypothetical protein